MNNFFELSFSKPRQNKAFYENVIKILNLCARDKELSLLRIEPLFILSFEINNYSKEYLDEKTDEKLHLCTMIYGPELLSYFARQLNEFYLSKAKENLVNESNEIPNNQNNDLLPSDKEVAVQSFYKLLIDLINSIKAVFTRKSDRKPTQHSTIVGIEDGAKEKKR